MSEANILNATAASLLNPLYGWQGERAHAIAQFAPPAGPPFARLDLGAGIRFQLEWELDDTNRFLLAQWAEQYAMDFFSLADHAAGPRYYSGRFAGPVRFSPLHNNSWRAQAVFEELLGLALNTYPTNWARDATFLEERNGLGEELPKFTGTWFYETDANDHGGNAYNSGATNNTAEWLYFGYGFRFWSKRQSNLGIAEVSATKLRDGSVALAATNVDLYNAAALASAALLTKADLPLDWYRVKLRVTGTKNAASTGFPVLADAVEVMR